MDAERELDWDERLGPVFLTPGAVRRQLMLSFVVGVFVLAVACGLAFNQRASLSIPAAAEPQGPTAGPAAPMLGVALAKSLPA